MELLDTSLFSLGGRAVTGAQVIWAAFFVLAGVILSMWGAFWLSRKLLWKGTDGPEAARLVIRAVRWKGVGIGVLAAAAALGLNVLPLIWIILGLGAIAALILREAAWQMWAGMLLIWERPFTLGERIRTGEFEGEVEGIGLRATYLRSEDRLQVLVPNSYVATHAITNWTRAEGGLRVRVPITVVQGADTNAVINTLRKAAERNNRVRSSPSPKAFLVGFRPDGLRFEVIVWVANYTEVPWVINELCRAIDSDFRRDGIRLAIADPAGVAKESTARADRGDGRGDRSDERSSSRRSYRDEERSMSERESRNEERTGGRDRGSRRERPERHRRTETEDVPEVQEPSDADAGEETAVAEQKTMEFVEIRMDAPVPVPPVTPDGDPEAPAPQEVETEVVGVDSAAEASNSERSSGGEATDEEPPRSSFGRSKRKVARR